MKLICEREKLLQAFQTVAAVVPTRSPKPILQHVKVEASEQEVSLLATDLEVSIRMLVQGVQVESGGSTVLPVARFGSVLRELNDEKITLEVNDKGATVRGDRSKFHFPVQSADEFPTIAPFTDTSYFEIPARLLKELIRRTEFATDVESSRYALGGVLFEFEEQKLIAVGTDGRRLAKMEGPIQMVGKPEGSDTMTIVPTKAIKIIERSLSDPDASIRLARRGNDIIVASEQSTTISRLVEGRFPKWRDVFPDRQDGVPFELTAGPVFAGVRQASIVASQESRGIDLTFGEGSLVITAKTAEVGDSRVELPIAYDGEAIVTSLDHRFLADFLKVLDSEKTFTLDVKDEESAALFTTDDGYGYVVMPLARDS